MLRMSPPHHCPWHCEGAHREERSVLSSPGEESVHDYRAAAPGLCRQPDCDWQARFVPQCDRSSSKALPDAAQMCQRCSQQPGRHSEKANMARKSTSRERISRQGNYQAMKRTERQTGCNWANPENMVEDQRSQWRSTHCSTPST